MADSKRIQNAISLGISADTQEARKQLNQMFAVLKSVKDPAKALADQSRLLKLEVDDLTISTEEYNDAMMKVRSLADAARASIARLRAEQTHGPGREQFDYGQRLIADRERELESYRQAYRNQEAMAFGPTRDEYERFQEMNAMHERARQASRNNEAMAFGPTRDEYERFQEMNALHERARQASRNNEAMAFGPTREEYERFREINGALERARQAHRNNEAMAFGPTREEYERFQEMNAMHERARQASRNNEAMAFGPTREEYERFREMNGIIERSRQHYNAQAMGPNRQTLEDELALRRQSEDRLNTYLAERARRQALGDQIREAARENQARGSSYMSQFDNPSQAFARQVREARMMLREGAISADQYARAISRIRFESSTAGNVLRSFRGAIASFVGPLTALYAGTEAIRNVVRLTANLDQARAKFRVFLGSNAEAEKTLKELRLLASTSPVSFTGGQAAVTTMLQFGVAANEVLPALKAIAEITAGDSERMQNLALAYSQSAAAGRLMAKNCCKWSTRALTH